VKLERLLRSRAGTVPVWIAGLCGGLTLGLMVTVGVIPAASASHHVTPPAAGCSVKVARLATGYGSPDDLLMYRGHILFDDIQAGVVASITKGRTFTLVRNLSTPEGMVSPSKGRLIVVEQGSNRLESVDLLKHQRHVLLPLKNDTRQEGVDGISLIHGDVIIPDSPYGTILRLHKQHLSQIAWGLSRPTDVVAFGGGLAVADENAGAIWLLKHGHRRRLASLPTPDDVVVAGGRLLAVTLGDGSLWEIKPKLRRLTNRFSQPQGLVTVGSRVVAVADSRQNAIYRVTLSRSCR